MEDPETFSDYDDEDNQDLLVDDDDKDDDILAENPIPQVFVSSTQVASGLEQLA
jgi:hypothetical protein